MAGLTNTIVAEPAHGVKNCRKLGCFSCYGKTVAAGARLALFDFASAFGTAPLPARPIARDAEHYPLEN